MVVRHNRRTLNDNRRTPSRASAPRAKERNDLLPWADPYIASLMRNHELQKGLARSHGEEV